MTAVTTRSSVLKRLRAERDDARRWAVRLEGMLRRAQDSITASVLRSARDEADRDRVYQRLASRSAESASYQHQRTEAVVALADLLSVVQGAAPDAHAVLARVGAARAIVERYRRPATAAGVVPPGAHKTG